MSIIAFDVHVDVLLAKIQQSLEEDVSVFMKLDSEIRLLYVSIDQILDVLDVIVWRLEMLVHACA
jgi:hypothetical protein